MRDLIRRDRSLLAFCCALFSLLAACGGGGSEETASTAPPIGATPAAPTPVDVPVAPGEVEALDATLDPADSGVSARATFALEAPRSGENFLSDLAWVSARNDLGPVEIDRSNGTAQANDGNTPMIINGVSYTKGLGVHGESEIVYALNAQCSRLRAVAGINDFRGTQAIGGMGSVRFQVFADATRAYESPVITGNSAAATIDLDMTNVRQLRLVTKNNGDPANAADSSWDHADWANATVTCAAPPAPAWTFCANEGALCSFTGTRQVRYGANARFVVRTLTAANGGVMCTNEVFGDPIPGTVKTCQIDSSAQPVLVPTIATFTAAPATINAGAAATLSWTVTNAESLTIDQGVGTVTGTSVRVQPPSTTSYTLTARNAAGSATRTTMVTVNPAPPPPANPPTISAFTAQPVDITTGQSSTLRWTVSGADSLSIAPGIGSVTGTSRNVSPTATTTYTLTATNPQGSVTRTASVNVSAPPPVPPPDHSGMGPFIDPNKIPRGSAGYSTERVSQTSEKPGASDGTGAFRTVCAFSHMNFDDPLVFPNQPGAAHLHVFFGNTLTNAASTADSIANTGNSTCRGGIVNRSSYWVPALIDTRDGTPLAPLDANLYYKTGYNGIAPRDIRPFPKGLRMIAGNARAAARQSSSIMRWSCIGVPNSFSGSIPNCPVGDTLQLEVFFPQCWDGVHVDSTDHKSHMAYPSGGACPATHPVPIPAITFNIGYRVTEANSTPRFRLSSDMYDASLPAGFSGHGDWFEGWKEDIKQAFVKFCDQAAVDCHSHLLGDGRAIN